MRERALYKRELGIRRKQERGSIGHCKIRPTRLLLGEELYEHARTSIIQTRIRDTKKARTREHRALQDKADAIASRRGVVRTCTYPHGRVRARETGQTEQTLAKWLFVSIAKYTSEKCGVGTKEWKNIGEQRGHGITAIR